jgi:hypothetical protein
MFIDRLNHLLQSAVRTGGQNCVKNFRLELRPSEPRGSWEDIRGYKHCTASGVNLHIHSLAGA